MGEVVHIRREPETLEWRELPVLGADRRRRRMPLAWERLKVVAGLLAFWGGVIAGALWL